MPPPPSHTAAAALSQAVKDLRRRRGLRPAEAADAMDMPLRSYEHFEAGKGRINLERVLRFARVMDVDPFGLLATIVLRDPALALGVAENKALLIFHMALQDFVQGGGQDLAAADPRTMIAAFTHLFRDLGETLRERAELLDGWLGASGRQEAPGQDASDEDPA